MCKLGKSHVCFLDKAVTQCAHAVAPTIDLRFYGEVCYGAGLADVHVVVGFVKQVHSQLAC